MLAWTRAVVVCGFGRAAARSGAAGGGAADRLGLRGDGLGERPDDLAERAARGIGGVRGLVVAVEHRHDQGQRLGRLEHQRRQPQPAADAVAAVGAAFGLQRYAGLAQDRDVAAGRAPVTPSRSARRRR